MMYKTILLPHLVVCALFGALFLSSCQSNEAPEPREEPRALERQLAPVPSPQPEQGDAESAIETALMVVQMTPKGELSVGHLKPRPGLKWVDRLVPYDVALHRSGGSARPGDDAGKPYERPNWELSVVAEHPSRSKPLVLPLDVLAPEREHGDVVDPWRSGGAIWRVPWMGDGTRYQVLRTQPQPVVRLATWEAKP